MQVRQVCIEEIRHKEIKGLKDEIRALQVRWLASYVMSNVLKIQYKHVQSCKCVFSHTSSSELAITLSCVVGQV